MNEFKVGQELWFAPRNRSYGRLISIVKIGRKWIYLDGYKRVDRSDLGTVYDKTSDSVLGKCYLSESIYTEREELRISYNKLQNLLSRSFKAAPGVTLADIAAAKLLLKL